MESCTFICLYGKDSLRKYVLYFTFSRPVDLTNDYSLHLLCEITSCYALEI